MYSVIDLFAGAGGLSLGFEQTHKYKIKVAFENNPDMQATYRKNFPNVDVRGDVCVADYNEIQKQFGPIDVVIGGPPCQGFSNANRQKSQVFNQNNMLVKQYIRAITELNPQAFIMENVSMLRSEVHRFYLSEADIGLMTKFKIPSKPTELLLIDKPYYFQGAEAFITNIDKVNCFLWEDKDYILLNIIFKASKNEVKLVDALEKHEQALLTLSAKHIKGTRGTYISNKNREAFQSIIDYYSGTIPASDILANITDAIMIQRMLRKIREINENRIIIDKIITDKGLYAVIRSFAVFDYMKAILESNEYGYTIQSDVLCAADYGAPQKRNRFVIMGIKKEISPLVSLPKKMYSKKKYRTVKDAIIDLENVEPVYEVCNDIGIELQSKEILSKLAQQLRDSPLLKNHIITKTTPTAMKRFKVLKQGQNFHDLKDELKTNTYTDISRTQNTIYQRLSYDEPCGTVVNVRKSMWIHPTKDRAVSIREAARLQTFPDSFVFCGSKDKQYQQVGNAVPPVLSKSIANKLYSLLTKKEGSNEHVKK